MTRRTSSRVAVVGAGYWGPNLIRNFRSSPDWDLVAVCDLDADRAEAVGARRSGVDVTTSLSDLLARDDIDAVAIATPARTHQPIALAALRAGKHVLVEKPLADSVARGARDDGRAGREQDLVLMADHTYCYTPAVQKIRELIAEGAPRRDPLRRLGAHQPRPGPARRRRLLGPGAARPVDPRLRPARRAAPSGVAAQGADPLGAGKSCVGYLTLPLPGGAMAHVHVNWLSPTKIRQMVIGGSERTLVWDDLNPAAAAERLRPRRRPGPAVCRHRTTARNDLLPPRRHLGAGPARAGGAGRDGRRVRGRHPRGPRAAHRRHAGLRVLSVLEAAVTQPRATAVRSSTRRLVRTELETVR